jgi:hypothetical protein
VPVLPVPADDPGDVAYNPTQNDFPGSFRNPCSVTKLQWLALHQANLRNQLPEILENTDQNLSPRMRALHDLLW